MKHKIKGCSSGEKMTWSQKCSTNSAPISVASCCIYYFNSDDLEEHPSICSKRSGKKGRKLSGIFQSGRGNFQAILDLGLQLKETDVWVFSKGN